MKADWSRRFFDPIDLPDGHTAKEVGDLKAFATAEAADRWFAEHDPEGVAFEYPVLE